MPAHPLLDVYERAAAGSFPPVDGVAEVMRPDRSGAEAIVELTGHAYVLTGRSPTDSLFDGVDAFGGVTQPAFVLALAGSAPIGSHDAVLMRRGGGEAAPLAPTDTYDDHPRVRRARHHRNDVTVYGDERGLATIGTGLAGRIELSVELTGARGSAGTGRDLISGALATVAEDRWVFAQVAPGNAASLRAFLAVGFVPIGSEILIDRTDATH